VRGARETVRARSGPTLPLFSSAGRLAGTPADIIRAINTELVRIFNEPDMRERRITQGIEAKTGNPQEMGELIRTGHAQWGAFIRRAGIKGD
jgi:tripartite-type tricarboxylate transporter receptor subunit TctC